MTTQEHRSKRPRHDSQPRNFIKSISQSFVYIGWFLHGRPPRLLLNPSWSGRFFMLRFMFHHTVEEPDIMSCYGVYGCVVLLVAVCPQAKEETEEKHACKAARPSLPRTQEPPDNVNLHPAQPYSWGFIMTSIKRKESWHGALLNTLQSSESPAFIYSRNANEASQPSPQSLQPLFDCDYG